MAKYQFFINKISVNNVMFPYVIRTSSLQGCAVLFDLKNLRYFIIYIM